MRGYLGVDHLYYNYNPSVNFDPIEMIWLKKVQALG
jgi:hypothetical protein